VYDDIDLAPGYFTNNLQSIRNNDD